ncbi:helix-turn-helix transcriptional regulator [Paracidovorax konjaci]|uniref:AraC family transcriptional regulator n=1 Tax=Paracidovorax konjaci TaxID=32040 RepID=A0A1I1T107_9BURK|nr:AraC family transcriptional regulator [Paracidovorax konjaci]SFD52357.1 AraC family transcriptional regulator [Paracidovorax konjaci]
MDADAASRPAAPCAQAGLLAPPAWAGPPMGCFRLAPAGTAQLGSMPADTLMLWTGGACAIEMRCDGLHRAWRRTSGTVDLLPAGTVVSDVRWDGDAMHCAWVHLEGVLAPGTAARTGVQDPHITDLVQRLEAQAREAQPLGTAYVQALALTLATYLRGRYGDGHRGGGHHGAPLAQPRPRARWEALRAYIDEHLGRPMSVPEMARTIGYSPNHFTRLFRHSFQKSPHQYVIDRRIERARLLLLDPARSIAEIAAECGFATQAHLSSAFKRRLGLTPGEFRAGRA